MDTKYISSTQAQNNFGQVLDDVAHQRTRYIVRRRGKPQVVVLGFDDFMHLLENKVERDRLGRILQEVRPSYTIGEPLELYQPEGE